MNHSINQNIPPGGLKPPGGYYKILLTGIALLTLLSCGRSDAPRKIRLADGNVTNSDAQLSTTIYLQEQERRSLAVLFFENKTGDQSLEWLRKGLTEMFIRTLGQSPSLSVMGTDRIHEIAERLGFENSFYFSKVFKKYEGVSPKEYLDKYNPPPDEGDKKQST